MRTIRAYAAGIALALAAASLASAADTEWEETQRRPALEGRPAEYKTLGTDTWIHLGPMASWVFPDGGLHLNSGPLIGARLELEPADVLWVGFELQSSLPGIGLEREIALDKTEEIEGHVLRFRVHITLKNPELRFGVLQLAPNLGFDVFWLRNYSEDDAGLLGGLPVSVEFEDTYLLSLSIGLRFEFDVSDHFQFGFELRNHFPFYSTKSSIGNYAAEEFAVEHYMFEPALYFHISF